MTQHTNNPNLPPPPSIDEVIELLPKDFKPEHPHTDRLASAIDAWKSSVASNVRYQEIVPMIIADMNVAIGLLSESVKTGQVNVKDTLAFLSKFADETPVSTGS